MEEFVCTERHAKVGLVRIQRPQAFNALNDIVIDGIGRALDDFEADDEIGCIVLCGGPKAFAAGADIAAMKDLEFVDAYRTDFISKNWDRIARCRKPLLAAVSGYALGGGCEVAMMCDIIYAAENAKFGQPEVKLGILPGAGATQRLPRAIGKAKAMELCLTGRLMDAHEAERCGLVARVVPNERLLEEALATAQTIASYSLPVLMMIKEAVNRAYETSLAEGLLFERRSFHAAFALSDQKEGMAAFLDKRPAKFSNR